MRLGECDGAVDGFREGLLLSVVDGLNVGYDEGASEGIRLGCIVG